MSQRVGKRVRASFVVLGTLGALLVIHRLQGADDARGPAPPPEPATTRRPSPSFVPPARTAVAVVEEPGTARAATVMADDGRHEARIEVAGQLVYEAPGKRPRVIAAAGAASPLDLALDGRGVVHLAWFDAGEKTIRYSGIEPGMKDEDIPRLPVATAATVSRLELRVERGVTIEYTDEAGPKTARP